MDKSVSYVDKNEKVLNAKFKGFFKQFRLASALKEANAYKTKGFSVSQIFQYLFVLIFSNRSMYMDMITGKNNAEFAKDTIYRFMKSLYINWIGFTTLLASRIIKEKIMPLTKDERVNAFVIDDSVFERNRSKKVELLAKIYDHAKKVYRYGLRMLTLGWTDGNTFLPVNSILLSSEKKKSRVNESFEVDKRTCAYKRRKMSMQKATQVMLHLLKEAKRAKIHASYVLFDSWFTSPSTIASIKSLSYDVIAMVKKTSKMHFRYQGENMPLTEIYKLNKKRRGKSKYLLSIIVEVVKCEEIIPARVLYVRNRNKKKDYLCLISTDLKISEDEIIRIYGKRWDIEVFFKVCKSYLRLSKECQSLSYDAMTAHVAVVFTRFMMLAIEERQEKDHRCWGELFLCISDELADITWLQSFYLLIDTFMDTLADRFNLSESLLEELMETFILSLPIVIKNKLKLT